MDNILNTRELSDKYKADRALSLPQRKGGIYYQTVHAPFIIIGVLLVLVEMFYLIIIGFEYKALIFIIGVAILYVFAYWPEEIYHEHKRWPRIVLPQFPKLKPVIQRLVKPNVGEMGTLYVPILDINGEEFFIARYIVRQGWWESKMSVDFKGAILLNQNGEIIQSTDLMLLAFLAFSNSCTGSVNNQKMDFGVAQNIKDTRRTFLPIAKWFLSMHKWQFEKAGMTEQWNCLMNGMEIQRKALADAYEVFADKDKVRKAIGYSFGTRYYLEDARVEAKIYRSFGNYMRAAYRSDLNNLNQTIQDSEEKIACNEFWLLKWLTNKAISVIKFANILIMDPVVGADWYGVPREWFWQAYVDRLKYARNLGLPIVEIGEFSEEYPVERIKELFPDYHWDK